MIRFIHSLLFSFISVLPLLSEEQAFNPTEVIKSKQSNPKSIFLTDNGDLTPELISLLKLDNLYYEGETFKEAYKKIQSSWILVNRGINNKERADLIDPIEWIHIRGDVLEVINNMGLLQAKNPSLKHYDYAICHGAFMEGVRFRLAQLIDQWNKGIRFDALVFLTGERTLRKGPGEKDDFSVLCNPEKSPYPFKPGWMPNPDAKYETEYDMVKLVWEQAAIPEDMAKALADKVTIVNTPKGDFPRPSMDSTHAYWLKEHKPKPGTIIAPSHPLIWCYQQLTSSYILGPKFPYETIAPESTYLTSNRHEPGLTSLIFDTIAKCMAAIDKSIENQ